MDAPIFQNTLTIIFLLIAAFFFLLEKYQIKETESIRNFIENKWTALRIDSWYSIPEKGLNLFLELKKWVDTLHKSLFSFQFIKKYGIIITLFALIEVVFFNYWFEEFRVSLNWVEGIGVLFILLLPFIFTRLILSKEITNAKKETVPLLNDPSNGFSEVPNSEEATILDERQIASLPENLSTEEKENIKLSVAFMTSILKQIGKFIFIILVFFVAVVVAVSIGMIVIGLKWIPEFYENTMSLLFLPNKVHPLLSAITVLSWYVLTAIFSLAGTLFFKMLSSIVRLPNIFKHYSWGSFFIVYTLTLISFGFGYTLNRNGWVNPSLQLLCSNILFDYITFYFSFLIVERILANQSFFKRFLYLISNIVLSGLCAICSIFFGLLDSDSPISVAESWSLLLGDLDGLKQVHKQYFFIMHTTFLPILIYSITIVFLLLSKLILKFCQYLAVPGESLSRPYAFFRAFFLLLAAIDGLFRFIL